MTEPGVPQPPRGGLESSEDLPRDDEAPRSADPIAGDRPLTGQETGAAGGYGAGSGMGSSGGSPGGRGGDPGGNETDWLRGETPGEAEGSKDPGDRQRLLL